MEKVIPPGQAGVVRITLHISDPIGTFEENYLVYSNDPRQPSVTLTLAGEVQAGPEFVKRIGNADVQRGETSGAFKVWPTARPAINLGRGERFVFALRIRSDPQGSSELKLITKPTELIDYKLRHEKKGNGYWLDLAVGPFNESGPHSATVELRPDGDALPSVKVHVTVNVPADNVIATPSSLDLGEILLSSVREQSRTIGRVGVRKLAGVFRITAMSSSLQFIRLEQQTIVDGSNYLIRITSDPNLLPKPGSYNVVLRIETDDSQKPRIEVPVKLVVVDR